LGLVLRLLITATSYSQANKNVVGNKDVEFGAATCRLSQIWTNAIV